MSDQKEETTPANVYKTSTTTWFMIAFMAIILIIIVIMMLKKKKDGTEPGIAESAAAFVSGAGAGS